MAGRDWRIEGKYVEYCSCDLGCPCESMADPTYGHCTDLVAFKIDKGYCEGVRLDDLAVVGTFYFPRAIHHGARRHSAYSASERSRASALTAA